MIYIGRGGWKGGESGTVPFRWWFDKDSSDWKRRVQFLQKMSLTDVKKIRSAVGVKHAAATKENEEKGDLHH